MKTSVPDPPSGPPRLLKLTEACELTSASLATLRRAIRLGKLRTHRIGIRALRVSEPDLMAWLASCRRVRR